MFLLLLFFTRPKGRSFLAGRAAADRWSAHWGGGGRDGKQYSASLLALASPWTYVCGTRGGEAGAGFAEQSGASGRGV